MKEKDIEKLGEGSIIQEKKFGTNEMVIKVYRTFLHNHFRIKVMYYARGNLTGNMHKRIAVYSRKRLKDFTLIRV